MRSSRAFAALALLLAVPAAARAPIPFPGGATPASRAGFQFLTGVPAAFTDNFTRADQTLETSPSWTVIAGSAGAATVTSNALTFAGVGKTNPTIYGAPDPGSPDQFAEVKLGAQTANANSFFVGVRCGATQFIALRISGTSGQLYEYNNGTFTNLSSSAMPVAGDVVRVAVSGNVAAYFINGVQQGTAGTTALTSGVPGFAIRAINQSSVATAWRSGAGSGS